MRADDDDAKTKTLVATDAARAAGAGHKEQPLFVERAKAHGGGERGGDRS
jgi:hypothetical protein